MSDLDLDVLPEDFDVDKAIEEGNDGDFKPLPEGWYPFQILEIEVVKSNNGKATMIKSQLKVVGPKYSNRRVFDQITILHTESEDAQRIGQARFGKLCKAAGFDKKPKKVQELQGKVVEAKLAVTSWESDKNGTQWQNEVKDYRPSGEVPDDFGDPEDGDGGTPF